MSLRALVAAGAAASVVALLRWRRVRPTRAVSLEHVARPTSGSAKACVAVLLNVPHRLDVLTAVWRFAGTVIAADGGVLRLYDGVPPAQRAKFVPDHIVGDFDSATKDVLQFYEAAGAAVHHEPDQNSCDLQKALVIAEEAVGKDCHVVVVGSLGGRLDHTSQSVNSLYQWRRFASVTVVTPTCQATLLPPGRSVIRLEPGFEGPTCGLLPIGGPVTVTTSGLKWDMTSLTLAFGGMVSSSNHAEGDTVVVDSDAPVVWTSILDWDSACAPL